MPGQRTSDGTVRNRPLMAAAVFTVVLLVAASSAYCLQDRSESDKSLQPTPYEGIRPTGSARAVMEFDASGTATFETETMEVTGVAKISLPFSNDKGLFSYLELSSEDRSWVLGFEAYLDPKTSAPVGSEHLGGDVVDIDGDSYPCEKYLFSPDQRTEITYCVDRASMGICALEVSAPAIIGSESARLDLSCLLERNFFDTSNREHHDPDAEVEAIPVTGTLKDIETGESIELEGQLVIEIVSDDSELYSLNRCSKYGFVKFVSDSGEYPIGYMAYNHQVNSSTDIYCRSEMNIYRSTADDDTVSLEHIICTLELMLDENGDLSFAYLLVPLATHTSVGADGTQFSQYELHLGSGGA